MTRPPPTFLLRALVRTRALLARLRARTLPVNAEILARTFSLIEARALGVAAELDLAEHLSGGPRSADELAAAVGADADAVERLLALLAETGCFARGDGGTWRNNATSEALRASHPDSMRSWARFFAGAAHNRIWSEAEHSVRTGDSAVAAATGHEFFDWSASVDPAAGALFNGAMLEGSRYLAASFAAVVDLSGARVLADIGGGTGRLLATVLSSHADLRGILYDLPEVVAEPDAALDPLADRVEVVAGSFFESVPPGADRHVLVSVLHDWDDDRARQILVHCREALAPGGRVLVVEQVLDTGRPALFERHTDLLMLVLTGAGRERTRADFDALFASAGFRVVATSRLATLQTVFQLTPGDCQGDTDVTQSRPLD